MSGAGVVHDGPGPDELLARADEALARAKVLGANSAEVFLWSGRATELHQGPGIRFLETSDRSGVSARLLVDGRLAFAKTSGLGPDDLAWTIDRAAASAKLVPPQATLKHFAGPVPTGRGPTPVDPELWDVDPARLTDLGDRVEDAAFRAGAPTYFSARVSVHVGVFAVANTQGVSTWDRHGHETFRLQVRCEEDGSHKTANVALSARGPVAAAHDLEQEAGDAVARAREATRTTRLDGFAREVILDGTCASLVLENLLASLGGQAAHAQRSTFAKKLGKQVASESVTIIDRPHGPRGCRHQRVDDEGVPTAERALIEDGVLVGHVYNWRGACETGERPTGHGLRPLTQRYAGQPSERPLNPVVQPGNTTIEAMIQDARDAVFVRDAILGSLTMDRVSGEFSFVAPLAFHVREGEVRSALDSTVVSGNLFEVIHHVKALGNRPYDYPHGSYVPIHLGEVTCAT